MDKERWRKVEEIFQSVVECEPANRAAFLIEACSDDEALRREVESLLAHEVFDTFIQQPIKGAAKSLASTTKSDLIGAQLGHYQITELIGEGGMGAVYAAVRDDELFNQKVAVKVVKRGMDSGFVLSRFQEERRILASLDHPNIARLIDGGSTPDGRPYFVMEFIEGQTLGEYCSAKQLSIADRIKLFRQICGAVQYAHQKLIAHRDIKPSNILITDESVPKLLDFGIAKLLDPTQSNVDPARTATMMRMMTPDYASPEQVRGLQITAATDIYSLGAVLYELLTGALPHQLETYTPTEIERIICETEVERPSLTAERVREGGMMKADGRMMKSAGKKLFSSFILHPSSLKGDLDNIILMAMRKEPARRYPSVEQFSDDLRRHLEKLPISARPDTIGYRAGKFVRRHRVGVAATALVLVSLLAGLIATNYQARRAERRFQQVRKLANTFLFDVHDEVRLLPGSTKAREKIVNTALEYLDSLAQEAGDAALQVELAEAYVRVGTVQGYPYDQNRGDSAAAQASFQKALAIYDDLVAHDPSNPKLLDALANHHIRIGTLQTDVGETAEAEKSYRETIHLVEKMTAAKMDVSPWLVTTGYTRMSELARRSGDLQEALNHQRRGFEFTVDWAAKHPGETTRTLLPICYSRLAGSLLRLGKLEEAVEAYKTSLQMSEDLVASAPESIYFRRQLISRYQGLAGALGDPDDLNLGRADEALKYFRKALVLAEGLSAADTDNVQDKREAALGAMYVAMMLRDSNPAEAIGLYRKSLTISEALSQSAPDNVEFRHTLALANRGLAYTLWRLGKPQEALPGLKTALDYQLANFAKDPGRTWSHRNIRRTYEVIGDLLLEQGEDDAALENYRQAQAITEKLLAIHPNDPFLRRDEVYCYESFGHFHLTLATRQRLPRQQRILAAREALAQYQRSLQTWNDWLARGIAITYANIRRNEAEHAIAECEAALTRLTSGRWK